MQVLIKTRDKKKHYTHVHIYDAESDSALCAKWPKPGKDWEIQKIESFSDIPIIEYCLRCRFKRAPRPSKQVGAKVRRRAELIEEWEQWTGTEYRGSY